MNKIRWKASLFISREFYAEIRCEKKNFPNECSIKKLNCEHLLQPNPHMRTIIMIVHSCAGVCFVFMFTFRFVCFPAVTIVNIIALEILASAYKQSYIENCVWWTRFVCNLRNVFTLDHSCTILSLENHLLSAHSFCVYSLSVNTDSSWCSSVVVVTHQNQSCRFRRFRSWLVLIYIEFCRR